MPCAVESLTVRMAAVSRSAVEEDIFLVPFLASSRRSFPVAAGFIQNAKAFHHQSLRGACDGLLGTAALEVDLKIALFPGEHFEDSIIALKGAVGGVTDLAIHDVDVAALARMGEGQQAALAAHFERLHEVDDVHLGQVAAQAAL